MVEIIPKPPKKRPLWQEILFYLGITLVIIVIASFFGLGSLNKKAQKEIQALKEQISTVKTSEEINLKKDLFEKEKKINDFAALLTARQKNSNLFPFLEKICHPKVQFLGLDLTRVTGGYQVSIPGQAESFEALHQQLLIFKQEPKILDMQLSGITVGKEGRVNFSFNLTLTPDIFKFQ